MEVARKSRSALTLPGGEPEAAKLAIEKFADAGVTCLRFSGIIDESFDGKKAARAVEGNTLVLDLGGIKKISSFGIREWIDFVTAAGKTAEHVILIECSPKIVDQLNMVANFAGGGRVFSFYAPFRCDYCDSEHRVLVEVARDYDTLRTMKLADRPCPACNESMYFDDDGASYFSYVLGQGPFELAPEVVAFLSAKLDYRVVAAPVALRVDKVIEGKLTYLRLAGDLEQSFPHDKLGEGVEGAVVVDLGAVPRVDPAGAARWRAFVQLVTPVVDQLWLIGVTPPLLEKLCGKDDLGSKTVVVDLVLPYTCEACGTTIAQTLDVAEHHAVLKFATAPEVRCPSCKAAMQGAAAESTMTVLPGLPAPALSKDVARVIADLRARRIEKPSAVARASMPAIAPPPPPPSRVVPMLGGALVVAMIAVGLVYYQRTSAHVDRGPFGLGPVVEHSAGSAVAFGQTELGEAACRDASGGLECAGASSPSPSLAEAEDEASDATTEAFAYALGSAISHATHVVVDHTARDAKLAAFRSDPTSTQARRDVRDSRRAVARALHGAPAPSERYWQAFDTKDGKRYVAFARIAVGRGDVDKVVAGYRESASALGATAITASPELAWSHPSIVRGAQIVVLDHGVLQDIGLAERYVVLAVDGHDVVDAAGFGKLATDEHAALAVHGGVLRLLVQTDNGDPREFEAAIAGPAAPVAPVTPPEHPQKAPDGVPQGGVNVWDRFGGNRGGGRNDPTQ
jgi:anti-anti-sigma regulatory factor